MLLRQSTDSSPYAYESYKAREVRKIVKLFVHKPVLDLWYIIPMRLVFWTKYYI